MEDFHGILWCKVIYILKEHTSDYLKKLLYKTKNIQKVVLKNILDAALKLKVQQELI